jgi:hypothetical protein
MAVRFVPGGVLRVPLDDGKFAWAVMLGRTGYLAFYRADGGQDLAAALAQGPAFIVGVVTRAYSKGRWGEIVERLPLADLPRVPLFFQQRRDRPSECFLVDPDDNRTPVTPAECAGYERQAAWADVHVEMRLNDLYAGRPSKVVEAMRVVR